MIRSMTVISPNGAMLTMPLEYPEYTGFNILSIGGLGPPKASVNMTELATADGTIVNSVRAGNRNVVINIQFMDFPDIETTRQRSYQYFPIKKKVTLIFETDYRVVSVDGYVESNEPVIFSDRTGTQISIICDKSYLSGLYEIETKFNDLFPEFEFPFGNESLTTPLIEMGYLVNNQATNVYYDGEVETGVVINIHATGPATSISIQNLDTGETMAIDTTKLTTLIGSAIRDGDDIIISTSRGSKRIQFVRAGVVTNIMNCIDRYSSWFALTPGDNTFYYSAATGSGNLQVTFYNKVVYEGI